MAWWVWILPVVVGVLGFAIFVGGLRVLFRGRPFSGGRGVVGGGALLALACVAALVGLNIQTYQRLTFERPVAQLSFVQIAPQHFTATLTEADGKSETFDLRGDQWRLEARVLRWRPWANILGLDAQYRLERLSGRYDALDQELEGVRSAYAVGEASNAAANTIDLWRMAQTNTPLLPAADTIYGSGVYMPMADGAVFEVTITQTGLIARPVNEVTASAVAQ